MKPIAPGRAFRLLLGALVVHFAASAAFAGFEGTEQFVAATGNPQGGNAAQFDSTFWATNLGSSSLTFTFRFLKSGQSNLSPASFSDSLAPGETKMYPSVISSRLGLTNVNGGARITSSGPMLAGMRLFNQPSGTALSATAGQFFSGVPRSFSIGAGQSASVQAVYTGAGLDFRYNFVLLETSGSSCSVHVQLLDNLGNTLGTKDYALQPYEQIIDSSVSLAPAASTTNGRIAATVTSGPGTIILAGSQVGNSGPQDQAAIDMSYRGALLGGGAGVTSLNGLTGDLTLSAGTGIALSTLGGNDIQITATGGGGGLAAVTHDGTLAGDGTGGSPLGIALPLTLSGSSGFLVSVLDSNGVSGGAAIDAEITTAAPGSNSAAVRGNNHGTGGFGIGVWGEQLGSGWGVFGSVTNAGIGVNGSAGDLGVGVNGTSGGTVDPNTSAVAASSIGTYGSSLDGIGVFGASMGTIHGASYGVHGEGVLGVSGVGTVQLNNSGTLISYGVEGDSYLTGDLRVGVFGYATGGTTNYAGYFFGNVNINGTTHTSGAATIMDDPLDPENKYIYHSSVASPDMKNLYDGVVTLDARGDAIVRLPEWFEAVNSEFRYQLTCIGGYSPVWVEKEVAGGQFAIKGEKPGQRVSWQLTGIRHDSWANAHRIQVEVEKSETERGTLLNPEDLGQPAERGLEWKINPQYAHAVEKQRETGAVKAGEIGKE